MRDSELAERQTALVVSNKTNFLRFRRYISNNKWLYLFLIPGVTWYFVFCYRPMYGILIAFMDYDIVSGVMGSKWVGIKHFLDFFRDYNFKSIMTNTIGISLLKLFFGFPAPILFALLLNEIKSNKFKRISQTISYLPYFVSWVVVAGIWYELFSMDGGVINTILVNLGFVEEQVHWFGRPEYFWGLVTVSDIWKNIGWNAIIYLAALSGIDPELYESSVLDGANRFQQTIYITLPCIRSTISVLFIFAVGNIMNAGFDQVYVMQNPAVNDRAQIIDTYVMLNGILGANYSVSTAVGLFKSVVGLAFLFITNKVIKALGQEGII